MYLSDWLIGALPAIAGLAPAYASGDSRSRSGILCAKKPSLQPPGWVFAVVWPVLYLLLGVSGALLWRRGGRRLSGNDRFVGWLALVAGLALWWPTFAIYACAPALAFASLAALAAGAWWLAWSLRRVKWQLWLLGPLCAWLAFATLLAFQGIP